ncbi:hypothetical protein FHG87_011612 [Trinorchestia longiramus]|nr:hypothetical protein FHG87_011612 [Trinorchestia longiramus]
MVVCTAYLITEVMPNSPEPASGEMVKLPALYKVYVRLISHIHTRVVNVYLRSLGSKKFPVCYTTNMIAITGMWVPLLVMLLMLSGVWAHSSGAPSYSCGIYVPNHHAYAKPPSMNPYEVVASSHHYNSSDGEGLIKAFSFASFGADVIMPPGRGPYCFRLQGQTYHFISGLHPNNDERRKYGQELKPQKCAHVYVPVNFSRTSLYVAAERDMCS